MKKIIIVVFLIAGIYLVINSNKIIIPKNSIRFRIIASDNSLESQKLKWEINEELIPVIDDITKTAKYSNDVKNNVFDNQNKIETILKKYTNDFSIDYGNNYFPSKTYDNIEYSDGYYESLVITLGNGNGNNWWCVMFPPLCLMEAKYQENTSDIEYKSYIKEIIKKY